MPGGSLSRRVEWSRGEPDAGHDDAGDDEHPGEHQHHHDDALVESHYSAPFLGEQERPRAKRPAQTRTQRLADR